MATFSIPVQNKQILFDVCVSIDCGESNQSREFYKSLFDTGAQVTMISEKVVQELGFQPIGDMSIIPASGEPIRTESYIIRLDVPIAQNVILPDGEIDNQFRLFGKEIEVGKLPYNPENYDVLIGMDFIGLFHVTMYNNTFILSN